MRNVANTRITRVWILTSALTLVSWGSALAGGAEHLTPSVVETLAVLAIFAVKARLILRQFMEVRTAPPWLRRFTDIWLAALWAAIVTMYVY